VSGGAEKIHHRRQPLVRRDLPVLVESWRRSATPTTLTTNGALLARVVAICPRRSPVIGEPRLADDEVFANDVDFPVDRVLRESTRGGGGLPSGKRRGRGLNELRSRAGPPLPRHRPHAPIH
jgi:hypothetical protein